MNDTPQEASRPDEVIPYEGWHVIHLFYQVDHSQWSLLSDEEKLEAKTNLTRLAQDIRSEPNTQLLTFSIVSPKADVGFMLLTPNLHKANEFEKKLTLSLGADILTPVYSYLSMTELSEYVTTDEQYSDTLIHKEGIDPDTPDYVNKMEEFRQRMKKYNNDKLYPNLPDWPVYCFYPMSKRRGEKDNWYSLDFEERVPLMRSHGMLGRQWHGKILQLITGSTGLDDMEWGVTLFAHNSQDVKEIVYRMRFDEASARFAEFGDFYIGLQLPLDKLFRRVGL